MISTKGRYALRFLIDVAEHQGEGYVPLKEVAARQEISEKYLEIIVKELVRGGFLLGVRGKKGGYRLSMSPEECCVKDIIELMEGPLAPGLLVWGQNKQFVRVVMSVGPFLCGKVLMRLFLATCHTIPWLIFAR